MSHAETNFSSAIEAHLRTADSASKQVADTDASLSDAPENDKWASTRSRWVLPTGIIVLLMAAVSRHALRPISDPDTFWHLSLGDMILSARSLHEPTVSWSELSNQTWAPTQWLTEVVASVFHNWIGLAGVSLLFATALLSLVVGIYRLCRAQAGPVAAAFATGVCVFAMSASLSPRPHMVTYLFMAVTLGAWMRTTIDLRARAWLIPLTWLWAMCHGMWFAGPALGSAILLGLVADGRLTRNGFLRLATIPLGGLFVAALTPLGPSLLQAPFAVAGVSEFIAEWQPPSFKSLQPAAAACMVGVVTLTWARSGKSVPWTRLMIVAIAAGWILLASRTVALGALLAAPLLAGALQTRISAEPCSATKQETWTIRTSALACLVVVALLAPYSASAPTGVPSALGPELKSLPDGAVILNSYELGGWIRWRQPSLEPVVDGMTEAYSVGHLQHYVDATAVKPGWRVTVRRYGATYALLKVDSPLALALTERLHWGVVATDGGYTLLRQAHAP